MAKEYQNRLTLLLDGMSSDLRPDIELQVKSFFGGAAACANGNICLSLTKVALALKSDGYCAFVFDEFDDFAMSIERHAAHLVGPSAQLFAISQR